LISADGFNKNTGHTSQNVVDQRGKYKNTSPVYSGLATSAKKKLKHRATQVKTGHLTTLVIIGSVTVSR